MGLTKEEKEAIKIIHSTAKECGVHIKDTIKTVKFFNSPYVKNNAIKAAKAGEKLRKLISPFPV